MSDLGATGLAENIERNAATLNEAHTRAMMAVISVNVLRSRDRWPTNYTTLSGIKSNPTLALNGSASASPIGLGNARAPFTASSVSVARNETANAEYSLNPFANGDRSQSLLKPIGPELLQDYWLSGWPRETLMWMFIDAVRFSDSDRFEFVNGDDFADAAGARGAFSGRFLELVRAADAGEVEFRPLPPVSREARRCSPVDVARIRDALPTAVETMSGAVSAIERLTSRRLVYASPGTDAPPDGGFLLCDPALPRWGFVDRRTGAETAEIRTRSFDDMIYFLGETLRLSSDGNVGEMGGVVLFRTYPEAQGRLFAVRVEHAGRMHYIAPQSPERTRGQAPDSVSDQSGNVLGLLNQLYQYAQSDEFLRAPEPRLR